MLNTKRVIFGVVFFASGITIAALSTKGPPPRRLSYEVEAGAHPTVAPRELARWLIEGRRDFTVIDLRSPSDFEQGHIRTAVNCGHCHVNRQESPKAEEAGNFVDLSKKLVVYTESGTERVELPRVLARNPNLFLLKGGWRAWRGDILGKVSFDGVTDDEARAELLRREAIRAFFAGERVSSGNAAELPVAPIKRESAHRPAAGAREGC
jgi:rhodanese-related sulfurtransferase